MRLRPLATAALLLATAAPPARGHDFAFTEATLRLREGGIFRVDVVCDLDALALGVDAAATDSSALAAEIEALPAEGRRQLANGLAGMLERRLRVRFDDQPAAFEISFPEDGRSRAPGAAPSALGLVAHLEGSIPPGSRTVSFFASRAFPPVRLTVVARDGRTLASEVLERGGRRVEQAVSAAIACVALVWTVRRILA